MLVDKMALTPSVYIINIRVGRMSRIIGFLFWALLGHPSAIKNWPYKEKCLFIKGQYSPI
jgi:hypothetical protein